MNFKNYLEKIKKREMDKWIADTPKLFELIDKDHNKDFKFKLYSKETKDYYSHMKSDLNVLENMIQSLEDFESHLDEDIYTQIIYLDQITLQIVFNASIDDFSIIARFILGVDGSKEKLLPCMSEGKSFLVEQRMKEITESSELEIAEAKEMILQEVYKTMNDRLAGKYRI